MTAFNMLQMYIFLFPNPILFYFFYLTRSKSKEISLIPHQTKFLAHFYEGSVTILTTTSLVTACEYRDLVSVELEKVSQPKIS